MRQRAGDAAEQGFFVGGRHGDFPMGRPGAHVDTGPLRGGFTQQTGMQRHVLGRMRGQIVFPQRIDVAGDLSGGKHPRQGRLQRVFPRETFTARALPRRGRELRGAYRAQVRRAGLRIVASRDTGTG